MPKAVDAPIYGGDDHFTYVGADDADRATTLYVVDTRSSAAAARASRLAAARSWRRRPRPPSARSPRLAATCSSKSTYAGLRAEAYKAMTSTGANVGDDWVPTFASSELWRDVHLATEIASQVRRVEMPTNPYNLPTATADPTFYYASTENTAVTGSNVAHRAKATLTAKKIQADVTFSGELTEDSIIPVAARDPGRAHPARGADASTTSSSTATPRPVAPGTSTTDDARPRGRVVLPRPRRDAEVLRHHEHRAGQGVQRARSRRRTSSPRGRSSASTARARPTSCSSWGSRSRTASAASPST